MSDCCCSTEVERPVKQQVFISSCLLDMGLTSGTISHIFTNCSLVDPFSCLV